MTLTQGSGSGGGPLVPLGRYRWVLAAGQVLGALMLSGSSYSRRADTSR